MRLRLIILCLLAGSLSGCVSRKDDPLPRQSVAARHATLADFPGTYRLVGGSALHRGTDVNGSPGSLTPVDLQDGDILRLTVSNQTITARYMSKGREIGSARADISAARLNVGRLICHRAPSRGVPILPGVIFSSGHTTTLYFAENRDLIIASQSWEAAAPLLIFPFYESERRVYRFHRISDHPDEPWGDPRILNRRCRRFAQMGPNGQAGVNGRGCSAHRHRGKSDPCEKTTAQA